MSLKHLVLCWCQTVVAPELLPVTVIDNLVVGVPICPHLVRLIRVAWMEIHYKKQVTFLKDDHLVLLVGQRDVLVCRCHGLILLLD